MGIFKHPTCLKMPINHINQSLALTGHGLLHRNSLCVCCRRPDYCRTAPSPYLSYTEFHSGNQQSRGNCYMDTPPAFAPVLLSKGYGEYRLKPTITVHLM